MNVNEIKDKKGVLTSKQWGMLADKANNYPKIKWESDSQVVHCASRLGISATELRKNIQEGMKVWNEAGAL